MNTDSDADHFYGSRTLRNYYLLIVALACCYGCGSGKLSDQPETAVVTGIILLDGKPLPAANVLFQPTEGRPSTGETDASGRYRLMYNARTPGAKLGTHTVHITTYRPNVDPKDLNTPEYPEQLPAKYHSQSELTANVVPGKNEISFELKSK